ncbi:hypothetical protein BU23DRAFT_601372 [Bimuria novae-zelandiae CBS 107.79]|uniref:Prenylcysteine lyase domain-containing protein n=1 Tax=Bimuria novae-zelandiae CBS 107.79 TaxID=1447943 RepID=A0A6A5V0M8_9PLEO|nr:hypothetical protein BU23DRAFT_601372 [Bimuria novae-zelandiae CBS 107.79]
MAPRRNPRSCFFALSYVTIFDGLCDASADHQTHRSDSSLDPSLRVAIVGAGVAGASAAFHLRELSRSAPISITIYDSEPIVGGHVVSVSAPEAPQYVFEAGAPYFFTYDDCLAGALESTRLRYPYSSPNAAWNLIESKLMELYRNKCTAENCRIVERPRHCSWAILQSGVSTWRHLAHLIARYGISTWRFHRTVASTSARWKTLGALRRFDNISHGLRDADISEDIAFGSAENYLLELGISPKFLSEYVEPCTRARFSQNLADVSASSALMAARRVQDASLHRVNARLIEHMINLSGANLRLNSTVVGISDGDTHRYHLSVASTPLMNPPNKVHTEYDIIILAFPLHDGSINWNVSDFLERSKRSFLTSQLYADSHVTHFSTSVTISPAFLHSSLNASIPDDLLTTAQSSNILSASRSRVCYRRWCHPGDELDCDQCDDDDKMYRVVSRRLLSEIGLTSLIGKQWRESQRLVDVDISWVHRQAWSQALPILGGNRNRGETGTIEIAPKLVYLGGVDRVLGSMEMSCRMGRNVARLLTRPGDNEMDVCTRITDFGRIALHACILVVLWSQQSDGGITIQTTFKIDGSCNGTQKAMIELGQKEALELANAVFDDCDELKTIGEASKCINWESQAVAEYFGPKAMNRGQRERIFETFKRAANTKRSFWSGYFHNSPTLVDIIKNDKSGQKKLNVKNLRSQATAVLHEWLHIKGFSSTVCEGGCVDTIQYIGPNGDEKIETYKAGRTKLLASKDVEKAARTNDNYAYFAISMWMQKNFGTYPPYLKI